MNDWKVIPTIALTTVLIFGAGVFTGGFLINTFKPAHNNSAKKAQHAENPAATNSVANPTQRTANVHLPDILNRTFLQRLDDELHLTPEQHDAIQKIINDGQYAMRKVLQDSRLEIRDALSPDQQKQFDELVKRPFKKPLFTTNSPAATQSSLSPEEQIVLMENQRTQAMNGSNAGAIMPVTPPVPMSAPPR